jgi:phosphatidylglycerophosphatase A
MGRASDWRPYVMAFLLFRLFDILKPWPIAAAERLPGGLGVMMDDVLAGFAAAILLGGTLAIKLV